MFLNRNPIFPRGHGRTPRVLGFSLIFRVFANQSPRLQTLRSRTESLRTSMMTIKQRAGKRGRVLLSGLTIPCCLQTLRYPCIHPRRNPYILIYPYRTLPGTSPMLPTTQQRGGLQLRTSIKLIRKRDGVRDLGSTFFLGGGER